jgi:two-component system sensor histidine kinase KdpD
MNRTTTLSFIFSFLRAAGLAAIATAAAWAMDGAYSLASQSMVYLLAVVFAAFRFGRRDAVICAFAAVIVLNFFFVPPRFTLTVENAEYFFTLAVFLLVSVVVSGLVANLTARTAQAQLRERRIRELHTLTEDLAESGSEARLLERGAEGLAAAFGAGSVLLLSDANGMLPAGTLDIDMDAARWVLEQNHAIGPATIYWPDLARWYAPLPGGGSALGVASVPVPVAGELPADLRHLQAIARQIGLALQRESLALRANEAIVEARTESLRNALLASISHDMRTPLAAILGSVTTLSGQRDSLTGAQQEALLHNIEDEAQQMSLTAENILQLARLSSDKVELRRDWESIGEIIGTVVGRQRARGDRRLVVKVEPDLPLVRIDAVLIEKVLSNLIENAIRHAPGASPVEIGASADTGGVCVQVDDRGPGFGGIDPHRLFAKFHRESPQGGAGLGLAICKTIVELHGGRIEAREREGGGATFAFSLPRSADAPTLDGRGNEA